MTNLEIGTKTTAVVASVMGAFLLVVVTLAAASAQTVSAPDGASVLVQRFRVSWEPRTEGATPTIGGWVHNDSGLRVTDVRLRVEGLDADRRPVGETFAWTQGDIPPGGQGYFVCPTLPGAATYRISVVSVDEVSH
jgi:hypothetical protein